MNALRLLFLRLIRSGEKVFLVTRKYQAGLLKSQQGPEIFLNFQSIFQSLLLWCVCLIHLSFVISPQAMLMRQQDRLEGRVQNIHKQITKLESDKTLMKVVTLL